MPINTEFAIDFLRRSMGVVWIMLLAGCQPVVTPSQPLDVPDTTRSPALMTPVRDESSVLATVTLAGRATTTPTRALLEPLIDLSLPQNQDYCPHIPKYPDSAEITYESREKPGYITREVIYASDSEIKDISEWFIKTLDSSGWESGYVGDSEYDMTHFYEFPKNILAPPVTMLEIRFTPNQQPPRTNILIKFTMTNPHSLTTWCAKTRP